MRCISLFIFLMLCCIGLYAGSDLQDNAVAARISGNYAKIMMADGTKSILPLDRMTDDDREFVVQLAQNQPLEKGTSQVTVAKASSLIKARKTILVQEREGPLETVQLVSPNVPRDQIGGTCMLYARVHWLDIAGYYMTRGEILKVINNCPPDAPWENPLYYQALDGFVNGHTPTPRVHEAPKHNQFEWARNELRKGRPLLAALPREIWRALPDDFLADRPWSGGRVGHQIVINGFTWNHKTQTGTFRVVNSWRQLFEFDLSTADIQRDELLIEASMSPVGEPLSEEEKASGPPVVEYVEFIREAGTVNLYEVTTDRGVLKVAAASESAARAVVESEE